MNSKRVRFDLMTALMLLIALTILLGLAVEGTTFEQNHLVVHQYGWPMVCYELSEAKRDWRVGGCLIDGLVAVVVLCAILIGRARLFRARLTDESTQPT